jgi:hypothetical protein
MQNEGTKAEVAQTFKGQGNEAVSELRWIDAKEFYTKSIAVIYAKVDKWEKPEDPKAEAALLRKLEEVSHINRALCNLELGIYNCFDCRRALLMFNCFRELPRLYPRLCCRSQGEPQERESLLPLIHGPVQARQDRRS